MTSHEPSTNFHFNATPRSRDDLRQIDGAIAAVERVFPGVRLDHVSGQRGFEPIVGSRDERLHADMRRHTCGGVAVASDPGLAVRLLIGDTSVFRDPTRRGHLWVSLTVKGAHPPAVHRELMLRVGDAALAAWGTASSGRTVSRLVHQDVLRQKRRRPPFRPPPFGLPPLYGCHMVQGSWAPYELGWLNYWCASVARWTGFPDPSRDEEWLGRAQQSEASGAWLMAVTDEDLDLDRRDHVLALQRAWARFDKVGVREPTPAILARWEAEDRQAS